MFIKSLNQWPDMTHSTPWPTENCTCSFSNFLALRNSLQFKVQYLYSKMMAQIPINVAYNIMQYAKNAT